VCIEKKEEVKGGTAGGGGQGVVVGGGGGGGGGGGVTYPQTSLQHHALHAAYTYYYQTFSTLFTDNHLLCSLCINA